MSFRRFQYMAAIAAGGAVLCAGWLFAAGQPETDEKECDCVFLTTADEAEWQDGPASLPEGAQYTVLSGDPSQEGVFTMRLRFPAGYRLEPHFHPAAEHVTVISGAFNMGKGERFDRSEVYTVSQGGFAMIPPEDPHYAWTEEETVVQLHGMGPWNIVYIDPENDPRQQ